MFINPSLLLDFELYVCSSLFITLLTAIVVTYKPKNHVGAMIYIAFYEQGVCPPEIAPHDFVHVPNRAGRKQTKQEIDQQWGLCGCLSGTMGLPVDPQSLYPGLGPMLSCTTSGCVEAQASLRADAAHFCFCFNRCFCFCCVRSRGLSRNSLCFEEISPLNLRGAPASLYIRTGRFLEGLVIPRYFVIC